MASVVDSEVIETPETGRAAPTLTDRLTDRLIEAVVGGELPPGDRVSEPELAERFGTSRGPLREALGRLEAMRLVERRPRQGTRVRPLERADLLDLFAVREALEGMAARLAAERMETADAHGLVTLLQTHATWREVTDGLAYVQPDGDLDFHRRVIHGSGNRELIAHAGERMRHRVRMYRHRAGRHPERPQRALAEHRRIAEAIIDRDGELAELLMRRHIRAAQRTLEEGL